MFLDLRQDMREFAEFFDDNFPIFMFTLIGALVIGVIAYLVFANKDNHKELVTAKVKILEKPIQQANIEWYLVECDNGQRLKLRNLNVNNVIISVGDIGMLKYRGQTIESFTAIRK